MSMRLRRVLKPNPIALEMQRLTKEYENLHPELKGRVQAIPNRFGNLALYAINPPLPEPDYEI